MATPTGQDVVAQAPPIPPPQSSESSLSPARTITTPELSNDDDSSEQGSTIEGLQMRLGLDDAYEIMICKFTPEFDYTPKRIRNLVGTIGKLLWEAWNFTPVPEEWAFVLQVDLIASNANAL